MLTGGTCNHLGFPVDHEGALVEAGLIPRLPAWILCNGTNDFNAMLTLTDYQHLGIGVALVYQVLGWKKVAFLKRLMNYLNHVVIRRRRRSGFNIGDQTRSIGVAALRKMHFVADPRFPTLSAVSRRCCMDRFSAEFSSDPDGLRGNVETANGVRPSRVQHAVEDGHADRRFSLLILEMSNS